MSDEYIKREDAINTVRNTFTGMTADTLELRINGIPSADVAPVRHGRWIFPRTEFSAYCNCSLCGLEVVSYDAWKYCPNCGAKMYEEETKE